MIQKSYTAPEIMERIAMAADKYVSRWEKSVQPEFRSAAKQVRNWVRRARVISENDPQSFVDEWSCIMAHEDIAVMRKILQAAKGG